MKWLKRVDAILLIVLSATAILLSVADLFGLLERLSWIPRPNYEALLLLLFATTGLHLGIAHLERVKFQESLSGGADRIAREFASHADLLVRGVHGVQIKIFKNSAEQELYLAKRLDEARVEVCDLSWKEKLSIHTSLPERIKSHKTYENSIAKAAKRIPYREVFVFSDERRKAKLRRRLDEQTVGYSCRHFDSPCAIPRLQFIIIDREEVVFASSSYPKLCAIRQQELAEIFVAYYEAIWTAATPLKDGDAISHEEVARVLGHRSPASG